MSPVVYTRRSRFLDEELDETKDVITSAGRCDSTTAVTTAKNISMVMTSNINGTDNGTPKSDYEPFHDTNCTHDQLNGRQTSKNPLQINTGMRHQQFLTLDKLENETISSKNANQSGTQSSSISNELNLQECALLRRQQLTRVAEWVHNNHMDKVEPISSQSASSVDGAASTDSGYKTKTNNNNIASSTNYIGMSDKTDYQRQLIGKAVIIDGALTNGDPVIGDSTQLPPEFAQNNNVSMENNGTDSHIHGDNGNNAQIDLAQMEYNVKQFLLKQNEWSIHNKVKQDSICGGDLGGPITNAPSAVIPTVARTTNATTTIYLHRTETNL